MNIIIESVAHLETLDAALRQNPDTRKIFVMIDNTLTGQSIRRDFLEQVRAFDQPGGDGAPPGDDPRELIQFARGRVAGRTHLPAGLF